MTHEPSAHLFSLRSLRSGTSGRPGRKIFLLAILLLSGGLTLATSLPARAQGETSGVTGAVSHYDRVVTRSAALYHKLMADARKKFDSAKAKADAAYDNETQRANNEVTLGINTIKEEVAQSPHFDAHIKDKIKGAARNFALAIAKARAIHEGAMAAALRDYTESLKNASATYADAVQKAEKTYRTEASSWLK
ncbi:MAG: hypothetical protein ACP5OS_04090 [Leptospirillia bacterium]